MPLASPDRAMYAHRGFPRATFCGPAPPKDGRKEELSDRQGSPFDLQIRVCPCASFSSRPLSRPCNRRSPRRAIPPALSLQNLHPPKRTPVSRVQSPPPHSPTQPALTVTDVVESPLPQPRRTKGIAIRGIKCRPYQINFFVFWDTGEPNRVRDRTND